MEKDCAFANLEDNYTFKFKEKQRVAVESILDGKDTFIVLPTGYGKSKIYSHLPEMYEMCKRNSSCHFAHSGPHVGPSCEA